MEIVDTDRATRMVRERMLRRHPAATPIERGAPPCHVLYMCDQIDAFMRAGRREKAMRWLGFVQGHMWSLGYADIAEMKTANRPQTAA